MQDKIRYGSITVLSASHHSMNLSKCSQQSSRGEKNACHHTLIHTLLKFTLQGQVWQGDVISAHSKHIRWKTDCHANKPFVNWANEVMSCHGCALRGVKHT